MYLAEKGLPQLYIPLSDGGVQSPCSIGGATACVTAGALLGVVLAQLVREGSPVGFPGWSGGLYNVKTMVSNYCQADEQGMMLAMGHYYGLPTFGMAGCSDSKALDQQAGSEIALTLAMQTLEGANIIHDFGFLDSGLLGSLPLMAMCNDWVQWVRHAVAGVFVTDEALALDVVHEIGPTGDYLSHPHTLQHCREGCYPKLVDSFPYSHWEKAGSLTMAERATRLVDKILESHKVEELPPDVKADVHKIVEREVEHVVHV
jgi:trimethylamine--corrinoid protein Co-methyltransferase